MALLNPSQYLEAKIDFAASGDNTVIAGVATKKLRIHKLFFVLDSPTDVIFKTGSTALTGGILTEGMALDFDEWPWFTCGFGQAFIMNLGAAIQCSGRVYYLDTGRTIRRKDFS